MTFKNNYRDKYYAILIYFIIELPRYIKISSGF